MYKVLVFLGVSLAKKGDVITSQPTTKTLITSTTTKLVYTYYTEVTLGDDEDKDYNLVGEIKLENLNTYWFIQDQATPTTDKLQNLRLSVGWRNPQLDAYDIDSFRVIYDRDENKVQFLPEDGYCYGSIDSQYYKVDGAANGKDQNGEYNSTIKQWTDNISPVSDKTYRVEEKVNDITIIESSVTSRPQNVVVDDVRQTFTVKYKKPFKASNIQDVTLQTLKQYNLTSYYGCYKDSANGFFGTNPDELYGPAQIPDPSADPTADPIPTITSEPIGCQGKWQGFVGDITYTNYITGTGETFQSGTTQGDVESQVTVVVLEGAQRMALAASSMILLIWAY